MARLSDVHPGLRKALLGLECPTYDATPLVAGPPLAQRRVALISTAGLHTRKDRPFGVGANDYRVIPGDVAAGDLVMSHISSNYDRSGFQQDWNVVFPVDRLQALAASGEIGSVADYHYSFMGATSPEAMDPVARELAKELRSDAVDAVLLVPV